MTATSLEVRDAHIDSDATGVQVRARVGEVTVWWRLPTGSPLEPRGEAFALAGLMPAMRLGVPLVLPTGWPIDQGFRSQLDDVQRIWRLWYPGLALVEIEAELAGRQTPTSGHAAGFSGGVDSSFTVSSLREVLDALVFVDGIDAIQRDDPLMQRVIEEHRTTAGDLGLRLLVVATNIKEFSNRTGLSWSIFHGAALASVAHLLGISEYFIAASNSWDNLRPMGSHPLTDPLLGSSTTRISHHGANTHRIDKVRALGNNRILLDRLRVCLQGTDWNCGHCAKCLQTAAELRVAGLRSASLPALVDATALRQTRVTSDGDLVDWVELLEPDLKQRDPELARELGRLVRRYRTRRLFRDVEQIILHGVGKRLLRKLGLARPQHSAIG